MKTEILKVQSDRPEVEKIEKCAQTLKSGGLVVFPTETVYGIAADSNNPKAVAKLYEVKKRSLEKPFSVLVPLKEMITDYTSDNNPSLYKLINKFWPGPLTVIVRSKQEGKTIGLRMPDNNIALSLIRKSQCALAAPSANLEGKQEPSTCQEALKDLDGLVDLAIDGGPSAIGKGSTIVDMTKKSYKILREGYISQEEVDKVTKRKSVVFICTGNSCRSVMADYLLKDLAKDREDVDVCSAGTGVFLHSTASLDTLAVLSERGIDASKHISMPIDPLVLKQADLVFVMTRGHRAQVLSKVPEIETKLYLLREFADEGKALQSELDIPDPMGGSYQGYKECFAVIEQAVNKVFKLL